MIRSVVVVVAAAAVAAAVAVVVVVSCSEFVVASPLFLFQPSLISIVVVIFKVSKCLTLIYMIYCLRQNKLNHKL